MHFPTQAQLNQALEDLEVALRPLQETPDRALVSGELQGGSLNRVTEDSLAAVYRVRAGGRSYTLRCFLAAKLHDPEIVWRYQQIQEFLDDPANGLRDYSLRLRVYPRGLAIPMDDGSSLDCPVAVSDWVDGQPLDRYLDWVRSIVHPNDARERLDQLYRQWLLLLSALHSTGFAHGDLAANNVLVRDDGSLVLIDYDFAFLDRFAGHRGLTGAQAGYRHPDTFGDTGTAPPFDGRLDHFAGLVIATTILAVRAGPELWRPPYQCDDRLPYLPFNDADFQDPGMSPLFCALERETGHELAIARAALMEASVRPLDQLLPPLIALARAGLRDRPDNLFSAILYGRKLSLRWNLPALRRLGLRGLALAVHPDYLPAGVDDPGIMRIHYVDVTGCDGDELRDELDVGAVDLDRSHVYLRLFPATRDPLSYLWRAGDEPIAGGDRVARRPCKVRYSLLRPRGEPINGLVVESDDRRTPLPELVVVRKLGSMPESARGLRPLIRLGGGSAWRDEYPFSVTNLPANVYLGVFPGDEADGQWVTCLGTGAAGPDLRIT